MGPVQRVAGERAREAARRLAGRREAVEQERERLAQLQGFRREYEQKFAVSGQSGIDAYRLRDYNAFMARIDQAIAQQREALGRLESEVEALRRDWLSQWGNARALDQLVERYRREERHDEARREQKQHDAIGQRRGRGPTGQGS